MLTVDVIYLVTCNLLHLLYYGLLQSQFDTYEVKRDGRMHIHNFTSIDR